MASFFPANRIFGIAICTSAVLNMTVPGAMKLDNVTVLLMIRVLQGLVEVSKCMTFARFYVKSEKMNCTHELIIMNRVWCIQRVTVFGVSGRHLKSDQDWRPSLFAVRMLAS